MQFFKTLAMGRDDLKLIGVLVLRLASRFASIGSWDRLGVVSVSRPWFNRSFLSCITPLMGPGK